jgi:hypothetical protein
MFKRRALVVFISMAWKVTNFPFTLNTQSFSCDRDVHDIRLQYSTKERQLHQDRRGSYCAVGRGSCSRSYTGQLYSYLAISPYVVSRSGIPQVCRRNKRADYADEASSVQVDAGTNGQSSLHFATCCQLNIMIVRVTESWRRC